MPTHPLQPESVFSNWKLFLKQNSGMRCVLGIQGVICQDRRKLAYHLFTDLHGWDGGRVRIEKDPFIILIGAISQQRVQCHSANAFDPTEFWKITSLCVQRLLQTRVA